MGHPASTILLDPFGSFLELRGATKIKRFGLDLTTPRSASMLTDPWPFNVVFAVIVVSLIGPDAPTLQFGGVLEDAIPILTGEVRQNLYLEGPIYITNTGDGDTLLLEVHGR